MKKTFGLILLVTQLLFAQNGFESGNAFYKKGSYKEAINSYESVLNTKKESSDLYCNIANCYYKLNLVAPAIYNYEKALVLNSKNPEALNNIRFAQKLVIDDIKETPKVGFGKLVRDCTGAYHYNTWAWVAVCFSVGFLLFFLAYYFLQASLYKRIFFFGMFVVFVLLLLSILAAVLEKNHYKNERPAVIFASSTLLRKESKTGAKNNLLLHEGTKVYVLEKAETECKVQLTDGQLGWIAKEAIREVK